MSPLSCPRIALFGNFGTIVKAMKEKCSRNRILSALTSKWTILREDKLFIVRLGVKEPSHEIRPLSKTSFVVASLIHQNVKLWTLWNVFPVFQMFRLTEKYHSQETTMLTCSRKTIIVKSRKTMQQANELWTWGGKMNYQQIRHNGLLLMKAFYRSSVNYKRIHPVSESLVRAQRSIASLQDPEDLSRAVQTDPGIWGRPRKRRVDIR